MDVCLVKDDSEATKERWLADFEHYTSCSLLSDLQLDEPGNIGYTFKCMGAGLWAFQEVERRLQDKPDEGTAYYQKIIQELICEGGDADTNATVAGALLGARLGKSNLPQSWITDLVHVEWLEQWVQQLLSVMIPRNPLE